MENLDFTQIVGFVAIILALMDAYLLVDKVRQAHRAETAHRNAPVVSVQTRMDAYDEKLEEINRRIEHLEKHDSEHVSESRLILRGLLALTRHGVDGNNIQGLKDYQAELQSYLVDK